MAPGARMKRKLVKSSTFLHILGRPTYSCRRTYILPGILSFFLFCFFFFRPLTSELAERNSTKIGHMVGSKCSLKTHVRNLGYPLPYKSGTQKPPVQVSELRENASVRTHRPIMIMTQPRIMLQNVVYVTHSWTSRNSIY